MSNIQQWDTYRADNDGFNARFPVVTVLPLTKATGKRRKVYPFEVLLPASTAGNPEDSIIMPQQIRTVSKMRLTRQMGTLSDQQIRRAVEDKMLDHLGISLDEADD